MSTNSVTLELPESLYDELEIMASQKNTSLVDLIELWLKTSQKQLSFQQKWANLRALVQAQGGLDVGETTEEIVAHMRKIREEVFEETYPEITPGQMNPNKQSIREKAEQYTTLDKQLAPKFDTYFNFLSPDDIRLKGTRIGIETILYDFIHRQRSPEQIAQTYPSLTLEQVYATITYYHHKQNKIDRYLSNWLEQGERLWAEQNQNPSQAMLKLRQIKAQRASN